MTTADSGNLHDMTDQHVRTDFMQGIRQALLRLMREHGYSRERATSAILREISNGHSPHDNEVRGTIDDIKSFFGDQGRRLWRTRKCFGLGERRTGTRSGTLEIRGR